MILKDMDSSYESTQAVRGRWNSILYYTHTLATGLALWQSGYNAAPLYTTNFNMQRELSKPIELMQRYEFHSTNFCQG